MKTNNLFLFLLLVALILAACASPGSSYLAGPALPVLDTIPEENLTPIPRSRPYFQPGELVDYIAQSGDTLPALAARFNTTVEEILAANSFIPASATTMPPGMPMKIPIYYLPLWAPPSPILPDHAFVNSPTATAFSTVALVNAHPGWLKDYRQYAAGRWRSGAELVDLVATNYSLNPRLLLALLEYQSGALTRPAPPDMPYVLGYSDPQARSLYRQLTWAANTLNNGYYGWRTGRRTAFDLTDGREFRPDPWENAATVGIQYYFAQVSAGETFYTAIGPDGLARTYRDLFGDPWADSFVLIPGSLRQPDLPLPFPVGQAWTYTGGPHSAWGEGDPLAALDFAPAGERSGCFRAAPETYVIALGDGIIVRSETGIVVLDLDGDGNERTGWTIFYLHLATEGRAPLGQVVRRGDPVGWPSCEGGRATGTHVHLARKYNGEWIPADGPIPFTLDGWVARNGAAPYLGTLNKGGWIVTACECSDAVSRIYREPEGESP